MGDKLINYYQQHVKKTWKLAFAAAFLCCILVHIYKFTNTLPNFDAVTNVYFDQDMTISGRWLLQYACGISSYFDLPWLIGLLCAVYLGLITVVIVELYEIQNPIVILLVAGILACSPSTTEILFFEYTADGYLLGLLFSALSALYSCKSEKIQHSAFSGILLCASCAIYQSNISFGAILCVCFFLNKLFNDEMDGVNAVRWIVKHILIYGVFLAIYYAIWKVMLLVKNVEATTYHGISSVAQFSLTTMIRGLKNSLIYLRNFFLDWTLLDRSITLYTILNALFLVLFAVILAITAIKSRVIFKPVSCALMIIALLVIVPILSIWCLFSAQVDYSPRMYHSVCVLYVFAILLFDKWANTKFSTPFALLILVVIFNFAVMANISYQYLDDSYEKSYYLGSRMMERIETYEEDTFETIAFVGDREEIVRLSGTEPSDRIHLLTHQLFRDIMYYHSRIYPFMESVFDLDIPSATKEDRNYLEAHPYIQGMEAWPSENSIQVIDGILVVKVGEIDTLS